AQARAVEVGPRGGQQDERAGDLGGRHRGARAPLVAAAQRGGEDLLARGGEVGARAVVRDARQAAVAGRGGHAEHVVLAVGGREGGRGGQVAPVVAGGGDDQHAVVAGVAHGVLEVG